MSDVPPLTEEQKETFEHLINNAKADKLLLVSCVEKATGKPVAVIASFRLVDGEFQVTPLVKMFDGDPYEEVSPP